MLAVEGKPAGLCWGPSEGKYEPPFLDAARHLSPAFFVDVAVLNLVLESFQILTL